MCLWQCSSVSVGLLLGRMWWSLTHVIQRRLPTRSSTRSRQLSPRATLDLPSIRPQLLHFLSTPPPPPSPTAVTAVAWMSFHFTLPLRRVQHRYLHRAALPIRHRRAKASATRSGWRAPCSDPAVRANGAIRADGPLLRGRRLAP